MSADTNARVRRRARDRAKRSCVRTQIGYRASCGSGTKTIRGRAPRTNPRPAGSRSYRGCMPGRSPARGGCAGIARACPAMPGARWFPGARLNYAEHVLRNERPGTTALLCCSETTPVTAVAWETLAGQVRVLATRLRELGVRPGDRVVACLPNIPHAVVAMLATTSIGAIW